MPVIKPESIIKRSKAYSGYSSKLTSELVRISSISGQEEYVIRLLEKEFRQCGAEEVQIDSLGNVIARIGSNGPVMAFDGHVDTVGIGQREVWTSDPFSGDIKDGRIYGRGAADQKGGVAAMLTAMKIISELSTDLPFTLFFIGSIHEEDCDGLSWQYIINEDKIVPDIVVLTGPTDGRIIRGQRGRMEMEISVGGRSCHGSTPEIGVNAIYRLTPILSAIEKMNSHLPYDLFLGKGSITATQIRSGSPSLNAIPDMAAVYIDRRLTKGEKPDDALDQLKSLVEIQAANACIEIPAYENPTWRGTTYPTRKVFPSWVLNQDHHLIEYAGRCHKRLFGINPEIGKCSFSSNGVATMGIYGIPTFGFGPGEEKMAHAPNESVALDDISRAAAFYAYFPWIVIGQ